MATNLERTAAPAAPIVPSARRGTGLGSRDYPCSPLLPPDPDCRHGCMCWDCGRVTTRRDPDGSWRCLGALPPFDRCGSCGERMRVIKPGQLAHPSCDPESVRLIAISRDLARLGLPYCTCADLDARDCPHCKSFAQRLEVAR